MPGSISFRLLLQLFCSSFCCLSSQLCCHNDTFRTLGEFTSLLVTQQFIHRTHLVVAIAAALLCFRFALFMTMSFCLSWLTNDKQPRQQRRQPAARCQFVPVAPVFCQRLLAVVIGRLNMLSSPPLPLSLSPDSIQFQFFGFNGVCLLAAC